MKIAAVAWDIDGTLVDSEPLHLRALLAASKAAGVDLTDLPDTHFVGVNINDVWRELEPRFAGRISNSAWLEYIESHYHTNADELFPVSGALDAVRAFSGMGLRQVAVSNSGRGIVDANLRALGLTDLFEFSISLDDVTAPKPDPIPYALAAKRLDLDPAHILAVEDSETGAKSAHAAGLPVAFVGRTKSSFSRFPISDLATLPVQIDASPILGRSRRA